MSHNAAPETLRISAFIANGEVDLNAVSALLLQLADATQKPHVRVALLRAQRALFRCHGDGRPALDDNRLHYQAFGFLPMTEEAAAEINERSRKRASAAEGSAPLFGFRTSIGWMQVRLRDTAGRSLGY
jgi:hypothetical protein